ncbi:MAG: hypothetical protein A3G91_04465 [Omnitrophica WOR_2 bacterium RIFCSPLOWO2_12_FULL_50_9]|nr:MAG: hypothetical protein A3D87_03715 [Omnitrophica WOR_2 bacterium RIFCSPHIGHO2_02_FULL_50_17]OGX40811.1 MAG: hypothetical protein A3G91_04465 [Omnitrophica WOR_2 bacterium RIFCSPLOWO2_12_FULL_50_9]
MNREKTLKIILPVLVVLGILVWVRAFRVLGSGPRPSQGSDSQNILPGAVEISGSIPTTPVPPKKKSTFEDWGRNPFVSSSSGGPQRLILNGILWDTVRPSAIIDGEIVEIGGRIGPCTVLDIKPDKVLLNDGTRDLELHLGKEGVK